MRTDYKIKRIHEKEDGTVLADIVIYEIKKTTALDTVINNKTGEMKQQKVTRDRRVRVVEIIKDVEVPSTLDTIELDALQLVQAHAATLV